MSGLGARTLLLLVAGARQEAQQRALLDYSGRHGYQVVTLARSGLDAVRLVQAGVVDVVVVAFAGRDPEELEKAVVEAGGRLEYVRAPRPRVQVDALVVDMFRRGGDAATIAQLLDRPVADVLSQLQAAGLSAIGDSGPRGARRGGRRAVRLNAREGTR